LEEKYESAEDIPPVLVTEEKHVEDVVFKKILNLGLGLQQRPYECIVFNDSLRGAK
jgi:hypothetical protein